MNMNPDLILVDSTGMTCLYIPGISRSLPPMMPGMSFSSDSSPGPDTPSTAEQSNPPSESSEPPLDTYSTARLALQASNTNLEVKIRKLKLRTARLRSDLSSLHCDITTFQHQELPTWQADILTRLIDVVYSKLRKKLPSRMASGEHSQPQDRELTNRAYVAAAAKIDKKFLKKKFGLSRGYHAVLGKYGDIVKFRSPNPFQTGAEFAKWLVDEKENNPKLYGFWAKLFPVCSGKTVEENILTR